MFAVFAPGRNWLALTRPELPLSEHVVATVGWDAFLALAPAASCSLVALPGTQRSVWHDRLGAFRAAHPFAPLVIVADTALPPSVAAAAEVIRPPLVLRRLWPAMQRAETRMLLREGAHRLASATSHVPRLRRALEVACLGEAAIPTVSAAARAVGERAGALRAEWRSVCAPRTAVGLDEVLDWVLMLRLCAARLASTDGEAAETATSVHRHTISRVALRVAQMPLRQITPDASPRIRAAFRRVVLDLLTPDPRNAA